MGQKASKNKKVEDSITYSTTKINDTLPNITITHPTPIFQPDSPNPFTVPPPTPKDSHSSERNSEKSSLSRSSPPPPPSGPPPHEPVKNCIVHNEETRKQFGASVLEKNSSVLPPKPDEKTYAVPIIRPISSAKDRIALFESLNPKERIQQSTKQVAEEPAYAVGMTPQKVNFCEPSQMERKQRTVEDTQSVASTVSEYPVYSFNSDYKYHAEKKENVHSGIFPIDINRKHFGFCGRSGSGKSSLINSLRGLNNGDPQSAGRAHCNRMEPFRFIEGELQQTVLWEIPYPRSFSSSNVVFDANMGFDKFYESHKLKLFKRLFILIPDSAPTDEDITFAQVALSRRTAITFLLTKCDENLDAESRENGTRLDQEMKKSYETSGRYIFIKYLLTKSQILKDTELLFVNAPTTRNLVSGTVGYLHYLINEERLLQLLDLNTGCHFELEEKLRRKRNNSDEVNKSSVYNTYQTNEKEIPEVQCYAVSRPTILADAGFEISFGIDNHGFSSESKSTLGRDGKPSFNYGFIGGRGVGKSSLIDAIRGISSKSLHSATKHKLLERIANLPFFRIDQKLEAVKSLNSMTVFSNTM
uniref:IRG-type G domain-containing protein n=1 Tax=Caenorhabditis japonica TaxID=281687 RepID=A0A8R1I1A7_CAEJA